MFCTKCGQQVDDRATICPYCGSPMENASEPNTPPAYTPPTYTPPVPPVNKSKGLGIASIILGACSIVFAFIFAILGELLATPGLVLAIIGKVKKCGTTANIGLILSIIGLVVATIAYTVEMLELVGSYF